VFASCDVDSKTREGDDEVKKGVYFEMGWSWGGGYCRGGGKKETGLGGENASM
jgi:hypothetical protein